MFAGKISAALIPIFLFPLLLAAQDGTPVPGSTDGPRPDQVTAAVSLKSSGAKPQKSVRGTIEQAIKALEAYDCVTFAVSFLSPIKRAQIEDLRTYTTQRQCSPQDKGNVDEVVMALKLARLGVPEYRGITATISLAGVGLKIESITLMKYVDGNWYFNEL